jgi:hypothetical protein
MLEQAGGRGYASGLGGDRGVYEQTQRTFECSHCWGYGSLSLKDFFDERAKTGNHRPSLHGRSICNGTDRFDTAQFE